MSSIYEAVATQCKKLISTKKGAHQTCFELNRGGSDLMMLKTASAIELGISLGLKTTF